MAGRDQITVAHLRELCAAMRMYCAAKPEHQEAAAAHLKETITSAHSHGVLSDDETAEFIGTFQLAGA